METIAGCSRMGHARPGVHLVVDVDQEDVRDPPGQDSRRCDCL